MINRLSFLQTMVKLLIFDMDDTLYPEFEYVQSGFKEVAEELISQGLNRTMIEVIDELNELYNSNHSNIIDRFLSNRSQFAIYREVLIEKYRYHSPTINLKDEVKQLLDWTKSIFHIGLITDGNSITQKNKVKALGLENYFEQIVYTDELGLGYSKPHPKGFQVIMDHFNVNENEVVFVADNPSKDFLIKKDIKLTTVQLILKNGIYKSLDYEDGLIPDHIVQTYGELRDVLEKL